jgi:hypothetical protein
MVCFCNSSYSRVSNINFDILISFWGDPMHIGNGRQSSFSPGVYVKCIVRAFNWFKYLGGFLHLKPTAEYQISTLIFLFLFGGTILVSEEKLATDGKVLSHPRIRSNVLPGPLTDISSCVGICISSPHQGVKYQVWYLDCVRGTVCIFTISSLTEFINECIQALM